MPDEPQTLPPAAIPGHIMLDLDVTGLKIIRLESMGHEIRVILGEGDGMIRGKQSANVTSTLRMALHSYNAAQFTAYLDVLRAWKAAQTPLRLTAAPDRYSVLWGPDTAILVPRRD